MTNITSAGASPVACADPRARLRAIRRLVQANNHSCLGTDTIVCQIWMESRFDPCAAPGGSSARGLMQVLRIANRELFRLDNLQKPLAERAPDDVLYARADAFHDSPAFIDEATNIRIGTRYLQVLIDRARAQGCADPVAEAYKDYRGVRNGLYYGKIRAAADALRRAPDSIDALGAMHGPVR